jgi:hypothetical protein
MLLNLSSEFFFVLLLSGSGPMIDASKMHVFAFLIHL